MSAHKHFELAPGLMVKGDPDMSQPTKNALIRMFEIAKSSLGESPKPLRRKLTLEEIPLKVVEKSE